MTKKQKQECTENVKKEERKNEIMNESTNTFTYWFSIY